MSVTAALRVIIPLAVGGVMAGAIAIGANGGGNQAGPSAQVVAATFTPAPEKTSTTLPSSAGTATAEKPFYPNYVAPDKPALARAEQDSATVKASGQRCPATYLTYASKLLDGSFCFPATWKIVRGDTILPPAAQRAEGYSFSLLITKTDPQSGRELARVFFQVAGPRPFTLLDCPDKGAFGVASLSAAACFHDWKQHRFNGIPNGIARLIGVQIPHALDELPAVWAGIQLVNRSPDDTSVQVSTQDQAEALGIVASLEFNP
ncbi:MAG TPA: hypothetical protein VI759_10780 [Dehalococcoidia bacterium]|nr:hypothetical protein [Dehalococcoidia bacterium]